MAPGAPGFNVPERTGETVRPEPGHGQAGPVRSWTTVLLTGLTLLPAGLLVAAAWFGQYVRPSADEWCFLPKVRDHGISGLIAKFYLQDNGRIGNGLLIGLYAKFGVAGHQWFGVISAALVFTLLWGVTVLLLRRTGLDAPRGSALLLAAVMAAVLLLATINTYKTFYWPAASVSHTLAPVLVCAALIPLLWARTRGTRAAALAAAFVTACFLGTLSEETSVVVLVVLVLTLALSGRLLAERVRGYARAGCLAILAGTVTGTLLLVTSPGSRHRRERFGAGTSSMFGPDSLIASLRGYRHILETVLTTWQYVGVLAAGVLLGLLTRQTGRRPPVPPAFRPDLLVLAGAAAFLVSGYLCTVITYPAFGSRVTTAARTWNDYLPLYVVLLAGTGALGGRALRRRRWHPPAVATAAAAITAVACLGLVAPLMDLGGDMRVRARQWDRQDDRLRTGAARGARVLPYTPVSIRGMLEPFSEHGRSVWPAGCVADYYHLERVTYAPKAGHG